MHRTMLEEELRRQGRTSADVRAEAARTFGNVTLQREHARAIWMAPWLESVWQDVRYAIRSLGRSPAFTAATLVTMVIGIALNTAMFSSINAILLKPWPGLENAEDVVLLGIRGTDGYRPHRFSLDNVSDFETRSRTLAAVGASSVTDLRASADSAASGSAIYAGFVTAGFLDAAGVHFQMGRNFSPDDNHERTAQHVVVISHNLWQREYRGATDVVGRSLYLRANGNSLAYTVVGVTSQGWNGAQPYRDDAWVPLQTYRDLRPDLFSAGGGRCCVSIVGRLSPGASRAHAREELTSLVRLQAGRSTDPSQRVEVSGTAMVSAPGTGSVVVLAVLAGAIATVVVLLQTGANIAHLHLARAMSRRKEIQTRLAIGAGRGRIVRQLVTEGLVLSIVAGAISLVVVHNVTDVMMALSEVTSPEAWALDARVFSYCFGVAALTSIVFGLTPALRTTKVSLILGSGSTATPPSRLRFNTALLSVQIALSTVALTGAGLATRALANAIAPGRLGYTLEGVTATRVERSELSRPMAASAWVQSLQEALDSSDLPTAAFVDAQPFAGRLSVGAWRIEQSSSETRQVDIAPVSASAFHVLGIHLVEGRPGSDRPDAGEAVVSESLARMMWPDQSAVGKGLVVKLRSRDEVTHAFTVVGVAEDVFYASEESSVPLLHVAPTTLNTQPSILVRATGPAVAEQIKAIIAGVDPRARVTTSLLANNIDERLKDYRIGADIAKAGGLLALSLAVFGVFGIFAHVVEERRREIGIRVALGAQNVQVLKLLFGTTRRATLFGLAGGLLLSLGIGPMMGQYLYGLNPFDPFAFVGVAALLTLTGAVATWLPARRALSVDPAATLRQDT